jgi:hypothetical protein
VWKNLENIHDESGRYELYRLLEEAIEAENAGDFIDFDDFVADLRSEIE